MGRMYVTWGLAAAAALALAACGPKAGVSAQSGAPAAEARGGGFAGLFPAQHASFKATYTIEAGGKEAAMTIYGAGKKMRTENTMMTAATGLKSVTLMDRDAMQFVTYMEGPGAPKRATKLSADDIKRFDEMMPSAQAALKPTKIGADTVAGLACTVWQLPPSEAAPPSDIDSARQVCVTDDGIMLRAGSAAKPRMIATSVVKGPQDPALFALPAGYGVVDMGDCMAVMRQYAESVRSAGAKPDQAKFADCQKKMLSGMGAP